jgi:glutamate-ammonia-ligase adenylyltransferase
MRVLVAEEKGDSGPLDLKLAPGGLLDLDFLVQALVLAHGARCPDLVGLPAPDVLTRAAGHGLLTQDEAERLRAAYRQFDDVMHWQRLMVAGDPGQASTVALTRLAVALGMPDAAHLRVRLDDHRAEVRGLFDRLLA